jgi:sugar lactone lactonase YvrE
VSVEVLADRSVPDADVAKTVLEEGDKGGADGRESDAAGRIYATSYEHNAIVRRCTDGEWQTVAHDPRLLWPDTLSLTTDGHLYVTANQLHRQVRFWGGQDWRQTPYSLFRVRVEPGNAGY